VDDVVFNVDVRVVGGWVNSAPQTVHIVGCPWHASSQSGHQLEAAGIVMIDLCLDKNVKVGCRKQNA
jgi:hypothetical protein